MLTQAFNAPQNAALALIEAATNTPLPANTEIPTALPEPSATQVPSSTPLPTDAPTEIPTSTPEPSATPTEEPTATQEPTATEEPTAAPAAITLPEGVAAGEHWIDIDLTNQVTRAYAGDQLVRTFVVSTGTYLTPTVIGQYKVYVKTSLRRYVWARLLSRQRPLM